MKIRVEDTVKIIRGSDKGKVGKVLSLNKNKGRIVVEGINIVKRHTRPSAQHRQGGIIESEAPVDWSNVVLMCNKCVQPIRIKMKRLEDGKKVRACRKCDEIIDS